MSLLGEDLSSAYQLSKLLDVIGVPWAKCLPDSTPGNGRCSPVLSALGFGLMAMSFTDPSRSDGAGQ